MNERNPDNPYGEESYKSLEKNPWDSLSESPAQNSANPGYNPFGPRKLGDNMSQSGYEQHYYGDSATWRPKDYSSVSTESGDFDWGNLDEGRRTMAEMGQRHAWVDDMGISNIYNQAANMLEGKAYALPTETAATQSFNFANQAGLEDNPLLKRTYVEMEQGREKRQPGFFKKIGGKVLEAVRNLRASRDANGNLYETGMPASDPRQSKSYYDRAA